MFHGFRAAPVRRHFRPAGAGVAAGLGALLALATLAPAACAPTEAGPGDFRSMATTNSDFTQNPVAVGNQPVALAAADYDGVNGVDLAVANQLGQSVTLLTNDGTGNFSRRTLTVSGEPTGVFFAGMGQTATGSLPDLVVLSIDQVAATHAVSLFPNTAGALANTPATYALGSVAEQATPLAMHTGGKSDLVVTLGGLLQVAVLTYTGAGAFTLAATALASAPTAFASGDFNRDGNLDLAVLLPATNNALILLGDGNGGLVPGVTLGTGVNPHRIIAQDLDGDGIPDLAISNAGDNTVSLLKGDGLGGFSPYTGANIGVAPAPDVILAAPFITGASSRTLVITNRNTSVITTFAYGPGGWVQGQLSTTLDPFALAAGRFQKGGNLDFVVAEKVQRGLGFFYGDGQGGFARSQIGFDSLPTQPTPLCLSPAAQCAARTTQDLVVLQPNRDRIVLLRNVNP